MSRADLRGQLVTRVLRDGTRRFGCRIHAAGERPYFTIGYERDGWREADARVVMEAVVADVHAGVWAAPRRSARITAAERRREPSAAKAYEHIRKAAQHLDALHDATGVATVRLAARRGLTALYEAEDAVGAALRQSGPERLEPAVRAVA